jgi:outer membrane receptor for ferric coprogen and ferric-rhodotorulic acid
MLPVVTKFSGEAYECDRSETTASSRVYPFTRAHIDILQGDSSRARHGGRLKTMVPWLDGLSDIPFYTWDLKASLVTWEHDMPERACYTGNEADSTREDSVYFSYAILFLPRTSDYALDTT